MIEFIAEFIAAPEVHSSAYVMHIHVNRHVDTYFPCRLHDFKERGNVPRSLEFRERVPSLRCPRILREKKEYQQRTPRT